MTWIAWKMLVGNRTKYLVMLFGVFTGTFSSIYIASPVLMAIEKRWPGPAARGHLGPRKATPPAPSRKPQTVG